jgi:hypothetical protein
VAAFTVHRKPPVTALQPVHVPKVSAVPEVVAVRKLETPVNVVALEVNESVPPVKLMVTRPLPLLGVGASSVHIAILRLVLMVSIEDAGQDMVCSSPVLVVSGSHCAAIDTVALVVPTVTISARLVPVAGTACAYDPLATALANRVPRVSAAIPTAGVAAARPATTNPVIASARPVARAPRAQVIAPEAARLPLLVALEIGKKPARRLAPATFSSAVTDRCNSLLPSPPCAHGSAGWQNF